MRTTRIQLTAVFVAVLFVTAGGLRADTSSEAASESQFVQLDADSDGFVTLGEWKGGPMTFESLDRNGDAVLTRMEFFSREHRYRSREERFRELDTDRDGRISMQEWKWGEEALSVLDRDHDGFLSCQEFRCKRETEPTATARATASAARP